MPQTQQGLRQAWFRAEGGSASTYSGDIQAAAAAHGFTGGTMSEALLFLANDVLGTSYDNLPGALQAWAEATGAYNWSSAGDLGVFGPNLVVAPRAFDNAAWQTGPTLATVTPNNKLAPDGTMTADEVEDDSVTNVELLRQDIALPVADTRYGGSIFLAKKPATVPYVYVLFDAPAGEGAGLVIDVLNGTISTPTRFPINEFVQDWDTDWWRVGCDFDITGTPDVQYKIFPGYNATGGAIGDVTQVGSQWCWHAQLQTGGVGPVIEP